MDFKYSNKDKDTIEIDNKNIISKINTFKHLSKYQKMSLLIIVLLQIINNDTNKLENIFQMLNKQNLLDIKLIGDEYKQARLELHNIIQKFSNNNNFSNIHTNYLTHYNVIKTIGNGAYGNVSKIYNKLEKKYYALKQIFITDDLIDSDFGIFREIRILCDLNHTNIVKYHSSWINIENNNSNMIDNLNSSEYDYDNFIDIDDEFKTNIPILYIQMELCDTNFREYLLTTSLDDSIYTKIMYFKQILNAVKYIHDRNILHRDIKPENIFLIYNNITKFYTVKLGDFGLCKQINDSVDDSFSSLIISNSNSNSNKLIESFESTSDSTIVNKYIKNSNMHNYIGTGFYRDPELDKNKSIVNNKSIDIYSLGIILLELFLKYNTEYEKSNILKNIRANPNNINSITDENITTKIYNNIIINMLIPGKNRYDINKVINEINKIHN